MYHYKYNRLNGQKYYREQKKNKKNFQKTPFSDVLVLILQDNNKKMQNGNMTWDETIRWDKSHTEWVYDQFYRALVVFSMQITKSLETAEDLVQEVFVKLLERKPPFETTAALRGYLYGCVKNSSINYLRYRNMRTCHEIYIDDPTNIDIRNIGDEGSLDKEEIYRQLYLCIDQLPERQRDVFLLAMQGKRNADIAQQMQISINTVKVLKQRGKQALKGKLSPGAFILLQLLCT